MRLVGLLAVVAVAAAAAAAANDTAPLTPLTPLTPSNASSARSETGPTETARPRNDTDDDHPVENVTRGLPKGAGVSVTLLVKTVRHLEARLDEFERVLEDGKRRFDDDRVLKRLDDLEQSDARRQEHLVAAKLRTDSIDHNLGYVQQTAVTLTAHVRNMERHVREAEENENAMKTASFVRRIDSLEQIVPETRIWRLEKASMETATATSENADRWSIVKERIVRLEHHLSMTDREIIGLGWHGPSARGATGTGTETVFAGAVGEVLVTKEWV